MGHRQSMPVYCSRPSPASAPTGVLSEESTDEIESLLQRLQDSGAVIKYIPDGFGGEKETSRQEEVGLLARLNVLISRPMALQTFSDNDLASLMGLIRKHLFRNRPEIPRQFIICDQIAVITTSVRDVYMAMCRIVQCCIRGVPRERLKKWIDEEFLRNLVAALATPDADEQAQLELVIASICEILPVMEATISEYMIKQLDRFTKGLTDFPCAAPCLRWLCNYYKRALGCSMRPEVCLDVFIPCFTSSFLPCFYSVLEELCGFYYSYFDVLLLPCLQYLLRHWPVTHSLKIPLFISHIELIFWTLGNDSRDSIARQTVVRILSCLSSPHGDVVLAALKFLSDRRFLNQLLTSELDLLPVFYTELVNGLNSWHPEVRERAHQLIGVLKQNPAMNRKLESESDEKEKSVHDIWRIVFNMAEKCDCEMLLKEAEERFADWV
jgi:hypothetical protein